MSIAKDPNQQNVIVRMDRRLINAIDRQAKTECRNRSELIREACRIYVGLCDRPIVINLASIEK